jgi:hypothetical protein
MALVEMILRECVVRESVSGVMVEVDIGFEAVTRELDAKLVPALCWLSRPLVLALLLRTSASALL